MDGRVLGFTIAVSALTAVLFGVGPAWWASRAGPGAALKSGGRGTTGGRAHSRYRTTLIVTQFALALVLLAGAGFFIQGVRRLASPNHGWNPAPVISGVVNLASGKYNAAEPIIEFHARLRERLLALPGVESAAVCFEIPLYTSPARRGYIVDGRTPPPAGQEPVAYTNGVSPDFFDTVGIRLVRGRLIDATDTLHSRPVVVINDAMARALFRDEDPIGKRLGLAGLDDPFWAEIVGIVEDARPLAITPIESNFQVYKPYAQEAWQYVTIVVRAADPALAPALLEPIREVVATLDPDQPVINLLPVPDRIALNTGVWQTINQLLVLFAGLGLLLAALGIYGVITRLVLQRTGEIGIRLALGARVADVSRLILGAGLRMVAAGVMLGLIGAIVLARFLAAELPAFSSGGAMAIGSAVGLLAATALLACWLPARRAAKVDPMIALRAE
jgi:predicted permease